MRVYIAAPWIRKIDAALYAAALERAGHTITKKWWEHREVPGYLMPDISPEELQECREQAHEDEMGVLTADAFVLLNLEKSEGKSVETGIAFMAESVNRLVLVGKRTNLFHYDNSWEHARSPEGVVALLSKEAAE